MGATGYYQPWFLVGGLLTVVESALMYTITENSSVSRVYGYGVLLAVGGGSFIQAAFPMAQATVGAAMIPEAIGFVTLGPLGGGTIALAIANSDFLNSAARDIANIILTASRDTIYGAISKGDSASVNNLSTESQRAIIHAIVSSTSKVYIMPITAGALVTVVSLAMKRERLFMKAVEAA